MHISPSLSRFIQPLSFNDDEDTEEGEEKPRPQVSVNGHEHALSVVQPTAAILVGAKRRKCNIAHKINLEDKVRPARLRPLLEMLTSSRLLNQPLPCSNTLIDRVRVSLARSLARISDELCIR